MKPTKKVAKKVAKKVVKKTTAGKKAVKKEDFKMGKETKESILRLVDQVEKKGGFVIVMAKEQHKSGGADSSMFAVNCRVTEILQPIIQHLIRKDMPIEKNIEFVKEAFSMTADAVLKDELKKTGKSVNGKEFLEALLKSLN